MNIRTNAIAKRYWSRQSTMKRVRQDKKVTEKVVLLDCYT